VGAGADHDAVPLMLWRKGCDLVPERAKEGRGAARALPRLFNVRVWSKSKVYVTLRPPVASPQHGPRRNSQISTSGDEADAHLHGLLQMRQGSGGGTTRAGALTRSNRPFNYTLFPYGRVNEEVPRDRCRSQP
jgi:hypothetical protein